MSRRRRAPRSSLRRHVQSNPTGIVRVTAAGYAFVRTPEGEFFVPASKLGGAFDGDTVEIAPLPQGSGSGCGVGRGGGVARSGGGTSANGRDSLGGHGGHGGLGGAHAAARVLRVLHRANDTVVGRYEVADPFGVVVPFDTRIPYDIFTMLSDAHGARDGDAVRVRMVSYPTRRDAATGVIEEVLGRADDEGVAADVIIARHKLETRFSDEACAQAERAAVDVDEALRAGYRDIRDRCVFTIDPLDARDFDDALSLDVLEDGTLRLGVHIADVSHYVAWDSSLDLDARRRATSVYLADRVIPMLPEQLSNSICSLVPNEVRRTVSVDIYLDTQAHVLRCDFFESLICSKARLTYEQVQDVLEGSAPETLRIAPDVAERLYALAGVADALREQRRAAGSIDFNIPEAKALLDEDGSPYDVALRCRNQATGIVEEAMILANRMVAEHLCARGIPCIYRIHEAPRRENLADIVPVLEHIPNCSRVSFGRFSKADPFAVQEVIEALSSAVGGTVVSGLVLRAMSRARYTPECDAHYGLACEAYAHFTSPIRRYPDLVVHRMLKASLRGECVAAAQREALGWVAEHASVMERTAEEAERESRTLKLVEYMEGFIGKSFSAVISGVASFGVFVQLDNTAEGLVPVAELGREYFSFDARLLTLRGEDSGVEFHIGQRVCVRLRAAHPREGRLDFSLVRSF